MVNNIQTQSGFVAIIGRPNVGKSTLLNQVLGQKISITANKPQTTRHRILGIKTLENAQIIFMDTPGLHQDEHRALNKAMNRAVLEAIPQADIILFLLDAVKFTAEDAWIAEQVQRSAKPLVIGLNKVDHFNDKNQLLPIVDRLQKQFPDKPIVPFSALTGENISTVLTLLTAQLPTDHFYFGTDQLTDRSERFLAAELIREKLMRFLGQELPYSTAVMIDQFERTSGLFRISATIFVERDSQKAIVIGQKGARLKQIGRTARQNMERLFGDKVFLTLWVKVKTGWSDDARALKSLGYDEGD